MSRYFSYLDDTLVFSGILSYFWLRFYDRKHVFWDSTIIFHEVFELLLGNIFIIKSGLHKLVIEENN